MSLTSLLVDTFTTQSRTLSDDGTGGRTESWADGVSFLGRLSSMPVNERMSADKVTVYATHKLFCEGTVSLAEVQRLKLGARYFEIRGIVNPSNISHHLEIDLLEVD
jgi:head-tail adaptor